MAVLAMVSPLGAVSSAQAVVVKQSLSLSAPSAGETRLTFTLSGYGRPARAGGPVVVQRLFGKKWIQVSRTTQSSTGRYSVRTRASSAGRFTYRAVALSWRGAAAVYSAPKVVSVHAPYILLTPATAIKAETVKVSGKLPGVLSRSVSVQRRSGTRWVTLAKTKTTRTGSYATRFKAPALGSHWVRTLAPRVTIAGKVRARYATAAKTLRVVAQAATLTMPDTLVPAKTAAARLTFRPVRVGRVVALQVWRSGAWASVATGRQSAAGTVSLTMTAGTPGSYAYRAWTAARSGAPVFFSPNRILKVSAPPVIPAPDTTAPGSVTALSATKVTTSSITLAWTNPTDADFTGVTIRRAVVATAPASAIDGTTVTNTAKAATSYTDSGLMDGTTYSYAVFAHDGAANQATAATFTLTTTVSVPGEGEVSGTVTDAAGNGLVDVRIRMSSVSTGAKLAFSAADGSYSLKGLPTGADYTVCFLASETSGGSSKTGYLNQCTPTAVTVTAGQTTIKTDAVLVAAGAISGTVTDAAGNKLENIKVSVFSKTTGTDQPAYSAADGIYTVKVLPTGTDYTVCFSTSGASGGSSDATGYVDQCWQNLPTSGTPTPVSVALGETTSGINAVIVPIGSASVSPSPDVIATAVLGVPVDRSYTLTNLLGDFTGRAVGSALGSVQRSVGTITNKERISYTVVVPQGATSLRATIGGASDPGADLDLLVFKDGVQVGSSERDGSSEESVTVSNPAAGTYTVQVLAYSVPAGSTTYNYLDAFAHSRFGAVAMSDANALRAAGSSWTVPGTVTVNAVPGVGRVLLGNVQVLGDDDLLIGSGEVVIEAVTGSVPELR